MNGPPGHNHSPEPMGLHLPHGDFTGSQLPNGVNLPIPPRGMTPGGFPLQHGGPSGPEMPQDSW